MMTTSVNREIISQNTKTHFKIYIILFGMFYILYTHKTNDLVINKAITSKIQQQQTRKPNKDTSGTLDYVTQAGRTT